MNTDKIKQYLFQIANIGIIIGLIFLAVGSRTISNRRWEV
jgi:hypothetical protein